MAADQKGEEVREPPLRDKLIAVRTAFCPLLSALLLQQLLREASHLALPLGVLTALPLVADLGGFRGRGYRSGPKALPAQSTLPS